MAMMGIEDWGSYIVVLTTCVRDFLAFDVQMMECECLVG